MTLPTDYPKEQPVAYARSSQLDRTQQCLINKELSTLVKSQESGEPCIYTLISWLQDNAEIYLKASTCNQATKYDNSHVNDAGSPDTKVFCRYWIYSHHIYSKFKRRDVATLAKENSITGFCLAGKPGIICMEGTLEDCEYCWQKVKFLIQFFHSLYLEL